MGTIKHRQLQLVTREGKIDPTDWESTSAHLIDDEADIEIVSSATYVVAAYNANERSINRADYQCDGTADNVQIQAAIDALATSGGKIILSEGTFTLSTMLELYNNNLVIAGQGWGTILTKTAEYAKPLWEIRGDNIALRDMYFHFNVSDAANNAIAHSIDYRASHILFENCYFKGTGSQVLFAMSQNCPSAAGATLSEYIFCKNCVFDGTGMVGSPNLTTDWGRHIYLINCRCINPVSGMAGFNCIGSIKSDGLGYSEDINYIDCVAIGANFNNGFIAGNVKGLKNIRPYIEDCGGDGISLYCYDDSLTTREGFDAEIIDPFIIDCNVGIRNRGFNRFTIKGGKIVESTNGALEIDTSVSAELNGTAFALTGHLIDGVNFMDSSQVGAGTAAAILLVAGDARAITDVNITNCKFIDTQGTATQTKAIEFRQNTGGATFNNVHVHGNYLDNNIATMFTETGTVTVDKRVHHNEGYVTENSGTATVASGGTTVTVTHGLATTPTRVQVTPTLLSNAASFWITAKGATTFVINVNADPGAGTATFDWHAQVGEG